MSYKQSYNLVWKLRPSVHHQANIELAAIAVFRKYIYLNGYLQGGRGYSPVQIARIVGPDGIHGNDGTPSYIFSNTFYNHRCTQIAGHIVLHLGVVVVVMMLGVGYIFLGSATSWYLFRVPICSSTKHATRRFLVFGMIWWLIGGPFIDHSIVPTNHVARIIVSSFFLSSWRHTS